VDAHAQPIRDEGRCVYCKRDLFDSHDIGVEIDHLLPMNLRVDQWSDARKLVACCQECRQYKYDWKPFNKPDLRTFEGRDRLIKEAAAHIQSKKQTKPDWKQSVPEAETLLRQAINQYRRVKSLASEPTAAA
jgi:5-methylcytosine-specific restriction endonuclease McrA